MESIPSNGPSCPCHLCVPRDPLLREWWAHQARTLHRDDGACPKVSASAVVEMVNKDSSADGSPKESWSLLLCVAQGEAMLQQPEMPVASSPRGREPRMAVSTASARLFLHPHSPWPWTPGFLTPLTPPFWFSSLPGNSESYQVSFSSLWFCPNETELASSPICT